MRRGRSPLLFLLVAGVLASSVGVAAETSSIGARSPRFAGMVDESAVARFKALPPPVQSSDGAIFVGVTSPARAGMRWPVLQFAETVRSNFAALFLPLGSPNAPLSIELGSETNQVSTLRRRTLRTADGFSQLIIQVPNPDTVDLELLRVAVVEALLREAARKQGGSYGSLKWPTWFIEAAVDASRGSVQRAEAYERLCALRQSGETQGLQLDDFFTETPPPKDFASFFAQWVFQRAGVATTQGRARLLTQPWSRADILESATDAAWVAWLDGQSDTVFMPGVLTREQFTRWAAAHTRPTSVEEAQAEAERLSRFAVGRPKLFRDATELYLRALAAYMTGDTDAYQALYQQAQEGQAILANYFRRVAFLADDSDAPAEEMPK